MLTAIATFFVALTGFGIALLFAVAGAYTFFRRTRTSDEAEGCIGLTLIMASFVMFACTAAILKWLA